MNEENRNDQPVKIIGISLLLLILISFLPSDIELFGIQIKQVDIISDLKEEEIDDYYDDEVYEDEYYYEDEDSSYSDENESSLLNKENTYISASFNSFDGLISNISIFTNNEIDKINNYTGRSLPSLTPQPISGNTKQLKYFFDALKKSKSKKLRVAHYGDSALEGDLITSDLRKKFQSKFGGKGVGFLPITSQDANFRYTTKIKFSDDWTTSSIYTRNPDRLPVGISGAVFVNNKGSWVEYKTTKKYRSIRNFDIARVFYSDAKSSNIKYVITGEGERTAKLSSGKGLKEIKVKGDKATFFKLIFPKKEQAYIYGVSLEGEKGIYLDNFALRGNSGVDLKNIPSESLKGFANHLNYKLIIFEFGLNVLSGRKGNFSRYEKDMIKVINHFKKEFPKTSFLMIGAHDKCIKKGSKFVTDPAVLKLIETQINIAKKTNIAFWNLFEAMGGKNSMIDWVNANPPLAFKDYTHFNDQGAKKEANMLYDSLMEEYK